MTIALKHTAGKPASIKNEFMIRLQAICGEPTLLQIEDRDAYCALRDTIAAGVCPRDGVEAMWVQELTDITWEGWRRKKLKPALLRAAIPYALAALYRSAGKHNDANRLAAEYVNGAPQDKRRVEAQMAAMGFEADEINAKAYEITMNELYQLERLDAATDARRIAILREIDRHRAWAAAAVRNATLSVEQNPPPVRGGLP